MSPLTDADVDANESRGARSKREVILRGGGGERSDLWERKDSDTSDKVYK